MNEVSSVTFFTLEIERGRYNKTDVKVRLCPYCMRIDEEKHFILNCDAIVHERQCLFNKIRIRYPIFFDLDDMQKFQFLIMSEVPQILTWLAKFIYYGFNKRNDIHWKAYVCSLHHYICWLWCIYIFMNFYTTFYALLLSSKLFYM